MNETKTKKIEILNDAVIVIERYLDEIKMEIKKSKGCTAVPDNDKMPKSNYFIQNDDIRNWLYNKAEREMKIK